MKAAWLASALVLGIVAAPLSTGAQQAKRVYRIGALNEAWAPNHPAVEGLKAGLKELGFANNQAATQAAMAVTQGARPQDLPVEGANRIELTVNLKTAKTFGLSIPPEILLRADKLIH